MEEKKKWMVNGVSFLYSHDDKKKLCGVQITKPNYRTGKGIKVGDLIDKVASVYGAPSVKKKIYLNLGKQSVYFTDAYFYKGIAFYYQDSTKQITTIALGKNDFVDF